MRLIDADALKIPKWDREYQDAFELGYREGKKDAIIEVAALAPIIEAEPVKHGRWMWDEANQGYYCPHCPTTFWKSPDVPDAFKRCPICGAKMDGGDGQ